VAIGAAPAEALRSLEEHLAEFQNAVRAAYYRWKAAAPGLPELAEGSFFSLGLLSPAILEDLGRPRLAPTPQEIGLPEARLLRAWTRPQPVGGWDSAAGLPRRTRLAACAGSVYLYYLPPGSEALAALAALETTGIGLEGERGLGQVTVCASIHTQNG
jgi:CRISPR-associated Csx10 family RAMP protein